MYSIFPGACLLLVPAVLPAQDIDADSIPEPTQVSVVASNAGVKTTVAGSATQIDSDEAMAEVAVIEVVTPDDERQLAVRILLQRADQRDELYLDGGQVSQLRDEFAGFETWYERGRVCEAIKQCIHGVARCRPSQTVQQAVCPGFYSTPEGEQGVLVSTPRYSFRFPSTEPSKFVSTIDVAVGELDRRTANEQDSGGM